MWNFISITAIIKLSHVLSLCNMVHVTYIRISVLFFSHHHLSFNLGMVRAPPEVPYNTMVIISSILTIQVTIVTGVVSPCSNEENGTIWRISIVILVVSRELHSVVIGKTISYWSIIEQKLQIVCEFQNSTFWKISQRKTYISSYSGKWLRI